MERKARVEPLVSPSSLSRLSLLPLSLSLSLPRTPTAEASAVGNGVWEVVGELLQLYLTQKVYQVVLQKSIPTQIRQLIGG